MRRKLFTVLFLVPIVLVTCRFVVKDGFAVGRVGTMTDSNLGNDQSDGSVKGWHDVETWFISAVPKSPAASLLKQLVDSNDKPSDDGDSLNTKDVKARKRKSNRRLRKLFQELTLSVVSWLDIPFQFQCVIACVFSR